MTISWDCFDTIIGRSYVYPKSIFNIIANITNDKQFINKRIHAEQKAKNKTLQDIYKLLPDHDPKLELDIEKEYSFPIKENFDKISDGDIIVSDTYLSNSELLDLLEYHGLNKKVTVYASYGDKANGSIWTKILPKHQVDYHIGDNLISDIQKPRQYGLKTIYYARSGLIGVERNIERHSKYLSYWIRRVRLENPFFGQNQIYIIPNGSYQYYNGYKWICEKDGFINFVDLDQLKLDRDSIHWDNRWSDRSRDINRSLWDEQALYNLPILILLAHGIPQTKPVAFMMRDSFYLYKIYKSITENKANLVHANRKSLRQPYNNEYIKYLKDNISNKLIIDIHGTGDSLAQFCHEYGIDCDKLFICEHSDYNLKNPNISNFNLCFHENIQETLFSTRNNHNKKASIMGKRSCVGTILEKFNIPPDMGKLYGWTDETPIRKKIEHDTEITSIFNRCIDKAIDLSDKYKSQIQYNENLLNFLLLNIYNTKTYTNNNIHSLWD
jgi:hypothetical protein